MRAIVTLIAALAFASPAAAYLPVSPPPVCEVHHGPKRGTFTICHPAVPPGDDSGNVDQRPVPPCNLDHPTVC